MLTEEEENNPQNNAFAEYNLLGIIKLYLHFLSYQFQLNVIKHSAKIQHQNNNSYKGNV